MDFIGFCDWHQFHSLLLVRCMKGKSQCDSKVLLCQLMNFRHQTTGGDCNTSLGKIQSMLIGEHTDESQQIVIVIQRFAGSHYHKVTDPCIPVFFASNRRRLFKAPKVPDVPLNAVDLSKHLRRG